MKRTVLIILAILPALLFLPSCEKSAQVEEQMKLLEGKWAATQNNLLPDDPGYYAEVTKEEGRWIFRFHILDQKTLQLRTGVQGVTWNPVVGTYVFDSFSGFGSAHYESDRIILTYSNNNLFTWKRVPDSLSL